MKKIIALLGLFCFTAAVNAVPKGQPTMAVLPFQISPTITTINVGNLTITRTAVENEFSNQLINFLTKSRKFNMLTRTQIRRVMDENQLTESDWAKPGQIEKMGKLLVADYLVTGVINRLEFLAIQQRIAITGETTPRVVATFKCQFQIVESSTGKIVVADQVIKKLKSMDVRREIPVSERKDWTLADFRDLLFTKTATQVGNAILSGVYPIKIVEVKDQSVVLNRGQGAGIKIGDKMKVVNQGKPIIDVDTGESLGGSEEEVGVIEITSVEVKFSKAKIISGEGNISYGDVCRPIQTATETQVPDYPEANSGW